MKYLIWNSSSKRTVYRLDTTHERFFVIMDIKSVLESRFPNENPLKSFVKNSISVGIFPMSDIEIIVKNMPIGSDFWEYGSGIYECEHYQEMI